MWAAVTELITIDRVANKQQKCIGYRSGGWTSKIEAPADSMSSESLLPHSQAAFSLCPHTVGGQKSSLGSLL